MEPIKYKKGYTNFAGCKIDLSLKPFIPELETAFWLKQAIKFIKLSEFNVDNLNILDVFSGSGCIGIAILKHIKNSHVAFGEIDRNLIKQIKLNLKINRINPRRYEVIQSNIFQNIKNIKGKYDYIFANPPYISLKNKHLVQKSVLDYEPHLALFGGNDGLLYIKEFLKDARKYLKKEGRIYMEFDHFQKRDLEKLLKKLKYKNYRIYKDQFKRWRYICIKN